MTENKIVNNRTENKARRMLHTSLLTFLPSPLLLTLPPPIPLQFWCCLHSPAPVHWHLLMITAPACIPTDPNPFISPPSSNMHQEFVLWALYFGSRLSLSSSCFPGALGTLTPLPEEVISSTHGSHTMDPSGNLGPDPSPNKGNTICPNAPSHPSQHHSFPLLSGDLT